MKYFMNKNKDARYLQFSTFFQNKINKKMV